MKVVYDLTEAESKRVFSATADELQRHDFEDGELMLAARVSRAMVDAFCRKNDLKLMSDPNEDA